MIAAFTPPTDSQHLPIVLRFSKPGVLPPVYIATDFTDPPWKPLEMDFESDDTSDCLIFRFSKAFELVGPGEHQYKFRIGPDDEGWTVDDMADRTIDISSGHENNWLFVKSPRPHPVSFQPTTPDEKAPQVLKNSTQTMFDSELRATANAGITPTSLTAEQTLGNEDKSMASSTDLIMQAAPESDVEILQARLAVGLSDDVPSDLSTDAAMDRALPSAQTPGHRGADTGLNPGIGDQFPSTAPHSSRVGTGQSATSNDVGRTADLVNDPLAAPGEAYWFENKQPTRPLAALNSNDDDKWQPADTLKVAEERTPHARHTEGHSHAKGTIGKDRDESRIYACAWLLALVVLLWYTF